MHNNRVWSFDKAPTREWVGPQRTYVQRTTRMTHPRKMPYSRTYVLPNGMDTADVVVSVRVLLMTIGAQGKVDRRHATREHDGEPLCFFHPLQIIHLAPSGRR